MAIDAGYTITPLSGSGIQIQYSDDGETWHATFTDGDVYMRQKVDGGDWTDPIKIVGEDGKNAVVMTSATTPSGEYEGQVGIWQGQIYFWTNGEWVNQTPELPTDAVLHYSFDDVPDYPDGTADVRREYGDTFRNSTGYCYGNTTQSITNVNGNLHCTSTVSYGGVYFRKDVILNKICIARVRVIKGTIYLGSILNDNIRGVGVWELPKYTPSDSNYYIISNTNNETEWELEYVYIGDGSYSTPIIDNTNGQNNAVNNGGIAVQGVSGKGVESVSANTYLSIPKGNLTNQRTLSFWLKVTQYIDNRRLYAFGDADYTYLNNNKIRFRTWLENETKTLDVILDINNNNINKWLHIVVLSDFNADSGTKRLYINGSLIDEATKNYDYRNISQGTEWVLFNGGAKNISLPCVIDDFQIFDRALSETEVLALYQNKANTPKYYTLSDYSLDQIDDDNVIDHLTEKPQLLSKWLEIYNAKNVSSALPTSNVSTNGEYKGVINTANEVGVISTEQLENYIQATNALRSALWGTNGYLVDMNTDSTLNGSLDTLFANYRETLQIARTQITQQQASIASALSVVNSNPFQLIPVDSQGVVITGGYDNTGTRLQVYNGTTVLTPKSASSTLSNGEWKVTANGSGIVAGSQTVGTGDNKYIDFGNVSNLTAETAVITYTINVMLNNTPNTIYVVQKFGKSKEGADGRIYTLLPDYTAVKRSADGSLLTPSSVTVQAKSWTGSSIPEPYNDGDLKAFENNVQVGTTVHGNSITVTPTGDYPVVINLYRHETNTLIDTVTIPILQEVKGDTGRGLQSETSYYKLSANLTETFDSTTISTWTDSADSTPTAQKPYLHCAVLSAYTEEPTNVYGDDVIIREYVTNGTNGTSTRYSSASATSSTTSIALNTITGNTAVAGDVIIANSLLFVVTAVGSTSATVQYKQSIKGADNKSVTVLLSNQNPNVTSNSDGTSPVLTNTVTDIRVYENETELKYDASSTSNGYYKITVTASGCTHSSITDKGDYAQVNAISAMSADNATRTFAISGKRSDGTTFSFSAVQTITKSKKGNNGDNGVGITAVTEYYLRNNSSTAPAFNESTLSNWSTTASNPTSTAQYLWNAERITKSDGTTTTYEYMTPHLAMKYTANGTDGKGIVSIKNYYLATSLDSGVTTDTQGWTEAVQTVSSTNRYLWNYEEITYTTGNPTKTSPAIIGTFGAVSQGNWTASHSYKVSDIVYYQGSSYICKTAHTSGSTFDSSKWNKLADKGSDGKGVVSVIAYTALSTDTTKPAQSAFTTTAKSVDSTNRYLWRYEVTTYTDNSTDGSYADATIIGVWGNKGDSSLSASLSTSQVVLDCLPNRKVQTSQTIRVPYSAVNGNARTACTVTKINDVSVSTGSSLNKDIDISGVKLTQNTVGTSSADGSFTLSIEADATLGGVTSTYDKIIIPVVINVDNTPFTKNLVITKNVLTARFEVSQDSVYFTQRRNNLSNFEQYTISVAVKIGDVSRSISSISVTSLTGLTITSSTSNKTVTLKTSNGGTSPNGTITITVVSNEVTYTKTISIISKKSGKYLGKATDIGSSPYNQVTIDGSAVTANVGDFITWAGSDNVSKGGTTVRLALNYMYCQTGTSSFAWQNYEDDDDAMTSFSDVMSIIDSADSSISDNIKASVLCQRLVSANAFINKLFVRKIKLVTEGQNVGAIYGGKYNADGSIDTEATTDKGVYLDADGNFKASNGQFSGVVQDEKGFSYFNELLYEITVVNKTTQETSYYENLTYEQFLAYLNNSQYSTRQLGVKILNNGIEVFSLSQGQYIPQSYKIYSTNNILYVPTEDDYVGFSPADEFPSNNYIWIKYYQSNKLRSVEKLSRTRGYGYKLTSDGRAEFYDDVIIDGDLYLFGKEILKKARYDNDRHRYVNICSDDYDYNQGKGFNFGYDGSNNSYADINNLNVRNISGWKKSNETYSKITFDANNFAFNGQRTYTNITANSYSPSSSSSQRSALFNKIASVYDKIGGGYTHLGFMFGYNQSGTQQVIFSGSIYRIEKASDTVYRVHIYDEFGQTNANYLEVTSSSCIIKTEVSGSQVSSSVSTVKFVSIN